MVALQADERAHSEYERLPSTGQRGNPAAPGSQGDQGVVEVGSAPTISSLQPSSAVAGGPAFTLTVNGSGFLPVSTVLWNGAPRSTSYLSPNQLTAPITAGDIASAGTATVQVQNPPSDGGLSNGVCSAWCCQRGHGSR
jgi:hypothetical protein